MNPKFAGAPFGLGPLVSGLLSFCILLAQPTVKAHESFRIEVVDKENGWPVPLIELRTTHHVSFVSDNAGVIAVDLPELMGRETWFSVEGHGYGIPKDRFGYRGFRVTPRPGESFRLVLQRKLPAKRLGRITGGGIFSESQKFGEHLDWREQGIFGCDSVQCVPHRGKLFWAWGDTVLARYPLGRFHMIGATTPARPLKSFEPPLRLRFDYFVDSQQTPRNIAEMPGKGPTWLNGFVSLPDAKGNMQLVATYSKIRPPLEEYERGLCKWNEKEKRFERFKQLWIKSESQPTAPATPSGHTNIINDASGEPLVLFGDPFPKICCAATLQAWSDPTQWNELEPQREVPMRGQARSVVPHRGSIAWNSFRNCWVTVFTQLGGESSYIGELWYAEAETPEGPWRDAIQVVTHNDYSFYNPILHPDMTAEDSPVLLFEATFTKMFSGAKSATPRHNYNQVLYRLDLDKL